MKRKKKRGIWFNNGDNWVIFNNDNNNKNNNNDVVNGEFGGGNNGGDVGDGVMPLLISWMFKSCRYDQKDSAYKIDQSNQE